MSLNFNDLFGDAELKIECPECNEVNVVSMQDFMNENNVNCTNCNATIELKQEESFKNSVKSTNKALKDFDETLKKFGK